MDEPLNVSIDPRGVAVLMLNRPAVHNAMDAELIAALTQAAHRLGRDPAVRVVVLTGSGKTFCAGGDLAWMQAQMEADAETRAREARGLAEMLRALDEMPKPLIGRISGPAYGGGVGMMAVCDAAIGVDHAKFALTEVRLGLIPATIGPYVVARMGAAKARRVFFSGRRFDAKEAVDLGLLAKAVDADELDDAVEVEIGAYLEAAPGAVAEAKALVRRLGGGVTEAEVAASVSALVARWESSEAQDGIAAFFDKRNPSWRS